MDRYPAAFRTTLVFSGVVGLLLSAWAVANVSDPLLVVAFVAATAVLQAAPARIRDDVQTSLSVVGVFTGLLVGGTPLAVAAATGVALGVAVAKAPRRLARVVFNLGQFTLAAYAGGTVFAALLGDRPPEETLLSWHGYVALIVAALATILINHILVAWAVRLTSGDSVRATLRGVLGITLLLQYFYLAFAVVAAVLIREVHPATLVLLVVPAVIARRGLLGFQAQAEAYDRLVNAFVKVIEVKDPYTRGHADRVATLSEAVAGEMGHDYETRRLTRYAAILHDVGKVGIPADIINKPGALDDAEREIIKRHPLVGAEMLRDITFLQPAIDIVRCHHERLDGRGYPFGVPGEHLSPLVRIVTAVDAFDAMTSTRSYRRALDVDAAIRELRRHTGTQFDADVVEALAVTVAKLGWEPTVAFASADEVAEREGRRLALDQAQYGPAASGSGMASSGLGA